MIQANVAAAVHRKTEAETLFRVHDRPGELKLETFRQFLGELGLDWRWWWTGTNALRGISPLVQDRPDVELINTMLLRSMQQAQYSADNNWPLWFGAAIVRAFTSPIRRYPDLLLHRGIKWAGASAGKSKHKWTPSVVVIIIPMMIFRRWACSAQWPNVARMMQLAMCPDWLKCEYMQDHVGSEFDGVIANDFVWLLHPARLNGAEYRRFGACFLI